MHPRKRKLRPRNEASSDAPLVPPQHHDKPENPFQLYLQIRRQVEDNTAHTNQTSGKLDD